MGAVQKLEHRNIIKCEYVALVKRKNNDYLKIVMELCSKSLRKWLQVRNLNQLKYINRPQVYDWFTQLCSGLEYLHGYAGAGIIHRDLKPENVLIGMDNVIKICDLGLATDNGISTYTMGVGTQLYQPPEQTGRHYSKAVDIYPCGIMLFELLCIIEENEWDKSIIQLKDGIFPSFCGIKEVEKRLITYLTSAMPQYRPQDISTVIKIVGDLADDVKNRIEITPTVLEETYSCEEFVGKTRHGEIYKARNVEDSTDYAVKIIDTLDYSLELKKLFDNNSELLRLGHDNILQTFHYSISLDSNEGKMHVVTELRYKTLWRWIAKRNRQGHVTDEVTDRRLIYKWYKDICEVVKYLFSLGISELAMNEMTLDNIYITPENEIKIDVIECAINVALRPISVDRGSDVCLNMNESLVSNQNQLNTYHLGLLLFKMLSTSSWNDTGSDLQTLSSSIVSVNKNLFSYEKELISALISSKDDQPLSIQEVIEAADRIKGKLEEKSGDGIEEDTISSTSSGQTRKGVKSTSTATACCAMNVKCGGCNFSTSIVIGSITTISTLAAAVTPFIIIFTISQCQLDTQNYLLANKVHDCLKELGGNGTNEIAFIDTHYGHRDYLDDICSFIDSKLIYDRIRTESQDDRCMDGKTAFMYPSNCSNQLDGCETDCSFDNYEGFYCKEPPTTTTPSTSIEPTDEPTTTHNHFTTTTTTPTTADPTVEPTTSEEETTPIIPTSGPPTTAKPTVKSTTSKEETTVVTSTPIPPTSEKPTESTLKTTTHEGETTTNSDDNVYIKKNNKSCYKLNDIDYDDLEGAKQECDATSDCLGVWDIICDDAAPFYLCAKESGIVETVGDCVHCKQGECTQ